MEVEVPQSSSTSVRDKKRFEVKKVRLNIIECLDIY